MSFSPLSLSRRHVLGDLYAKCQAFADNVPVYLMGEENELLGHADQSLGHYADAVTFHLADDVCKRLSAGQYLYEFDVEKLDDPVGRVCVKAIFLKARKSYEKPRSAAAEKLVADKSVVEKPA
jgi:hypothetical protein